MTLWGWADKEAESSQLKLPGLPDSVLPPRYINHSCAPNCVAEVVTFDKEDKIIIISSRRIPKGEEVRGSILSGSGPLSTAILCHPPRSHVSRPPPSVQLVLWRLALILPSSLSSSPMTISLTLRTISTRSPATVEPGIAGNG